MIRRTLVTLTCAATMLAATTAANAQDRPTVEELLAVQIALFETGGEPLDADEGPASQSSVDDDDSGDAMAAEDGASSGDDSES